MDFGGAISDGFQIRSILGSVENFDRPVLELRLQRPVSYVKSDLVARAVLDLVRANAAVLIKGMERQTSDELRQLADAIFREEVQFQTGEHLAISGAPGLYEPVPFAPDEELLWHHENSFNKNWPLYILFASIEVPERGGQTTIVDGRLVYKRAPERLKQDLREHGIRYSRYLDGRAGRTWQQLYFTDEPEVARDRACAQGEDLVIGEAGLAEVHVTRPAFAMTAAGPSWFNQLLHWHSAALPADLRDLVDSGAIPPFRACALGNGEPIRSDDVAAILSLHRELELEIAWQPGDVLLLDNAAISHGRRPFVGHRKHVVRMAGTGTSR